MISLSISSSNYIFNGEVSVDQSITLSSFKRQLEQYTHISRDSQRILYNGITLAGDGPLRNYGLKHKDALYVVDRARAIPTPRIQIQRTIPYTPFARSPPNDRISTLTLSAMGARYPTTNCRDVTLPPFGTRFEQIRQNLLTYETLMGDVNIRPSKYFYRNYNYSPTPKRNQRQFFVGQLIDCLDTVKSWLEATITKIEYGTVFNPETGLTTCQMKLFVHFNGWPNRWDEYIPADSNRIALFRTRTLHGFFSSHSSPTQFCWVPDMFPTGNDDISQIFLALYECIGPLFSYLYSFSFESEIIYKSNRQHHTQINISNQYIFLLSKKLVPMCDRLGRILIDTSVALDSINLNIFNNRPPRLHRPLFLVQLDTPSREMEQIFNPAIFINNNNQTSFFSMSSPTPPVHPPTTQSQPHFPTNTQNTNNFGDNLVGIPTPINNNLNSNNDSDNNVSDILNNSKNDNNNDNNYNNKNETNNGNINPEADDSPNIDNTHNNNIHDTLQLLDELFFNHKNVTEDHNDIFPWNKYLPLEFTTKNINRMIINLLYPYINIQIYTEYYKNYKDNKQNQSKFDIFQLYSDYISDIFNNQSTYNLTNNKLYRNINSPLNFGASLLVNQGCIELQHPSPFPHYDQLLRSALLVQNTSSLIPPPTYQSMTSSIYTNQSSRSATFYSNPGYRNNSNSVNISRYVSTNNNTNNNSHNNVSIIRPSSTNQMRSVSPPQTTGSSSRRDDNNTSESDSDDLHDNEFTSEIDNDNDNDHDNDSDNADGDNDDEESSDVDGDVD